MTTTFQCQKCGFVFERHSEPSACPQCGAEYILPKPEACVQANDSKAEEHPQEP